MKITRLEIKDYQQFKDFTLDLTYPEGHSKAGKPLDKVCFIGQSGTGKTTLLNIVSDCIENRDKGSREDENLAKLIYQLDFNVLSETNHSTIQKFKGKESNFYKEISSFEWTNKQLDILYVNNKLKNQVIYFQTCLEDYVNVILDEINMKAPLVHTKAKQIEIENKVYIVVLDFWTKSVIKSKEDFGKEDFRIFLLNELDKYDRLSKNKLSDFLIKANTQNIEKVFEEFKQWKIDNPNPRVGIGEKLTPIFEKFNIKIDTDWADGGLKLKTLQDEEITIQVASTGAKQIMLSVIPLILMETANKVILFDEPENSLFPTIQMQLIDYYTKLAPEAQFFFATHSPLIAAQFEPCERFILEFDANGKVVAKQGQAPEGDDPNDVLIKDFGLVSLLGTRGTEALHRYVELKSLIRFETDEARRADYVKEFLEIGILYNFGYEKN